MIQILDTIIEGNFKSVITLELDSLGQEIVRFRGNLDIDADGANGQHGGPVAYNPSNTGRDILADVGYPRDPDEYSQGLICLAGTRVPRIFKDSLGKEFFASRTSLRMPGADVNSPLVGVDAEFFPYGVVPPVISKKTKRQVLGCKFVAINHQNGKQVEGVTADMGPTRKIGEGSPALARALGIPDSPRTGGMDEPDIEYILYPGIPAQVLGVTFQLQAYGH